MAFLVRPFHKHTVSVDGIECSPIISRATKRTRPRRVPRFGRMKNDDELNESYSECTTPLTALEKLGWPSTITLCVAPLTSLLALIFLILLWTPTFRNSWPVITTTSWLSRSVTLSALVIRTGADFLTAVCVSMLASLILESGACQLNDLAGISVMRAEAPSPWILLLKLKVSGNLSYTFLVLLLSILGIGLQFSSTILLADFTPGKVPGISNMTDYTYDLNWGYDTTAPLAQIGNQDIYNTTRYTYGTYSGVFQSAWTQRPKNVPVFGEYRQMVPRQSGVDDSGYVFTSFIPFDQAEQRTRVAKFQGPSFVLDSRVSCQRPNFLDIKATPALYNGVPKNPLWYTFIGHVTNSTNVEGLWFPTNASRIIPFGCQYKEITSILLQRNDTGAFEGGLGFHICQIQGVDTMIQFPHNKNKDWAILQPTESAGSLRSGLYPYTVEDSFPARGPAFLVIASNFTLNQSHSTHEAFTKVTFEFDPGSNIIATNQTAVEDVFFSLCFTSWESSTSYVEMSTSSPLQEPSIEVLDGQFNLDSILHHYGIGELSTPRAVLSLKKPYYDRSIAYPIQQPATDRLIAEWDFDTLAWQVGFIIDHQPSNHVTIVSNPISDQQFKYLDLFDAWRPSTGNTTALFHYQAIGSNDESAKKTPDSTRHPDPSYQAFFTHAMNKTNNSPALSLSALLTFISSSAYYEQFSILKKNATGEVTLFENVSYPQSINGLAVVTSLVLGHWIICAYILYLFLSISNLSRLGNAWSNVAQVCGTVTRDVIQNGTLASDDEIEKLLSNEGKGQRCIIMSKAGG